MKQPSYLDDLLHIIESIDIGEDGKTSFLKKPYAGQSYPEASPEARLFHNLSNLLYSACYTRSAEVERQNTSSPSEDDAFLLALRKANASTERYDCGWVVEEIEPAGNILVRKGGSKRYTYAGDFIRERFWQGPLQRGEFVNIRVMPEYVGESDLAGPFYFVFGETLLDDNNSTLVRVYFNISPEGAGPLIKLVSKNLNHFNIPFQFKCLKQPGLYTRCDAAVLYIDKRYFAIVGDILSEGYAGLKPLLKPRTPMFTRMIAPGIGFAENPFNSSESFGTSRCKIVAQGIVNAWVDKQPKERWLEAILKNIQQNYLRPEAPYLNPNSKYPYHFPDFEI